MKIKENFKDYDGTAAWDHVVEYVKACGRVTTMKGITFSAKFVGSCIFLKGGTPGTKRYERGEYLTGKDFIAAYDTVKDWDEINTGNVKPYIKAPADPVHSPAALLRNHRVTSAPTSALRAWHINTSTSITYALCLLPKVRRHKA